MGHYADDAGVCKRVKNLLREISDMYKYCTGLKSAVSHQVVENLFKRFSLW
jgi:hypothetical protein